LTAGDLSRLRRSSRIRIVRMKLGLTQEDFAGRFGLSLATLRDWEQGRSEPDHASRTLLTLIETIPDDVKRVLERTASSDSR
jgi:putative transcriptional regulator